MRAKEYLKRIYFRLNKLVHLPEELERQRTLLGALALKVIANNPPTNLDDSELRVFSQFGEDGILQAIIASFSVPVPKTFVEFGVENYLEATTRLLLEAQGWRGLVLDSDARNIQSIHARPDFWTLPLTAVCAFVDRENINQLIESAGFGGHIGILSVDIDGNDYWVWEAIECATPDIVVIEYNGIWGPKSTVSIPYQADFRRLAAHYSGMYWGCSLGALEYLAEKKGYRLVGVNSSGINAFFVRSSSSCALPTRTAKEIFREPVVRQARTTDGRLCFAPPAEAARLIEHLPLVNVRTGKTCLSASAFG